jgi:transposase
MHTNEPYPSSFTDQEWGLIEPMMPGPSTLGRPARYARRSVIEGILYIVRSGCGWRMLPHDLPPLGAVLLLFLDVAQSRSLAEDS